MRRVIARILGAVLVAGLAVGFTPTPARATGEGIQSMVGTIQFGPPPAVGANYCKTISGPMLTVVSTTTFNGPVAGTGSGTVCGTWPLLLAGNLSFSGTADLGVVTADMRCDATLNGTVPGSFTYLMNCLLTVTSPTGTTTVPLCVTGVGTVLGSPIIIGAGIAHC